MSKRKKYIDEFFATYETHFNDVLAGKQDIEAGITNSFADCFVESSPTGVNCGKNDAEFLDRVKQGFEFYRGIGARAMNIVSKDITLLDDFHAIVKVYWRYTYSRDAAEGAIDFHVFYLVTTFGKDVKIFTYIAGDEQKMLKEKGLITDNELVAS